MDLLREGTDSHAVIDEGLAHPRHLQELKKRKETGLSRITDGMRKERRAQMTELIFSEQPELSSCP